MWTTETDPYKWYKDNYLDLAIKGRNCCGDENRIFEELEEQGSLGELKNEWCFVFTGEDQIFAHGFRQKDEIENALYDWCLEHSWSEVDDLYTFHHGHQLTFDIRIND